MVGLCGVATAAGSLLTGLLLVTVGGAVGGARVVCTGLAVHLTAYLITGLTLPHGSALGDPTAGPAAPLPTHPAAALAAAALCGAGDAALNTQIMAVLSTRYLASPAQANSGLAVDRTNPLEKVSLHRHSSWYSIWKLFYVSVSCT